MVTPSSFYLSVHFILRKVNEKWKFEDLQMPFYIEHRLYVYLKTGSLICSDAFHLNNFCCRTKVGTENGKTCCVRTRRLVHK